MKLEFLVCQERYYIHQAGSGVAWCWQRLDDQWTAERQALPPAAQRIELAAVPADLREEIMAFAARAQAMGPQAWSTG